MNRRDFLKAGTGAFFFAAANRVFGAGAPREGQSGQVGA